MTITLALTFTLARDTGLQGVTANLTRSKHWNPE